MPQKPLIEPGKTRASDLITQLGRPRHVWKPSARPEATLLDYPDGCNYQTEQELVVSVTCPPIGKESTLQYWRHHWTGDHQRFEELPNSKNVHGQRLMQLASKERHMAVVYDESTGRVIRVVHYAE